MIEINISHATEISVLVAAIVATILSGLCRWRIIERDRVQRLRLDGFRGAVPAPAGGVLWYRQLGSSIAASPLIGTVEQHRLLKLLAAAGIKSRGSLANFIALKVCGAVVLAALVWIGLELGHLLANAMIFRLAALGAAFIVGWRLPDFVLGHLIRRRRLRLESGMPDALDLMVICAEAGLSLNQSIEVISRELHASHKDVSYEFATTSAEMQVLADIGQALDNLVERTGLPDLRSLIATLKQSLKFGTPLAESLRTIAAEMRAARQARYEQRAARLPVLLSIPMMMFILPCLLMIVGTPVVLRIMDVFKNLNIGIGAP
jgi:tight adherence protein C